MRRGEEEEGASRSSTSLFALLLFIHSQFNLHKFKLPQYKRLKNGQYCSLNQEETK